jgi:hypothetical protein
LSALQPHAASHAAVLAMPGTPRRRYVGAVLLMVLALIGEGLCPAESSAARSAPHARLTISPTAIKAGQTVTLSASRVKCTARPCRFTWAVGASPGSLRPVGRKATLKRRFAVGRYLVRLTVRDARRRSAQARKRISVAGSDSLSLAAWRRPPVSVLPSAEFTFSPASPVTGQEVTFSAEASSCAESPCTYTWDDVGSSGAETWPLGSGSTLRFTFSSAGTKYVRLTVTDSMGRADSVQHNVVVSAASPTPTPTPTPSPSPSPTPTPTQTPTSGCTEMVSSTSQLQSRVVDAPDGSVLCLASGSYGALSVRDKKRSSYLTIQPAPGASVSLKPFYFNNTSYFRITGVSVPATSSDDTTQLWKSNHLEISNSRFSTHGILIRGVKDSLISGNTITDIADGSAAPAGYGMWINSYITPTDPDNGLTGLVIRGNTFHNIPEDGIQMGGGNDYGTKNVLIENNMFDTIGATSSTAHSDSIQIIGGDRITVRANTFRHVQNACMWKDDQLTNSVVENNLMIGDTDARSGVGILCQIWDATNLVVRNNTIIQYGTYPGLMLRSSGSALVENNLMNKYDTESGVSVTNKNNLMVPTGYGFVGDFELPAGSAAIDAANDDAPATDRLGRPRVDNTSIANAASRGADIGANERH